MKRPLGRAGAQPAALGTFLGAALLWIATASPGAQSGLDSDVRLQERIGFSTAELAEFDAGNAVIRSLDTPVREELAYLGMVHLDAPADLFIERFRDIERFESGSGILQIGRFSASPRIEDLTPLTLAAIDVAAVSKCRPGSCDLKLSAATMERFRNEPDWTSPQAAHTADMIAREMILDLVLAYQAGGNAALGHYEDGGASLSIAEEFRALLASRDGLPIPIPGLLAYLEHYPIGRPAGAEEFFYWSVIDFGLKPTIRVNHVTILALGPDNLSRVTHVIAIKQLYASHYFNTALELRFLIDEPGSGRPGSSLISLARSRNDGMTGFAGLFRRPVISRRSRAAVRGYLDRIKRQIESPVPAAPCPPGEVPVCREW